ncbi:MAG: Myo-inositol 2-dehydrogenase [Ignavibacteriae bacterium]|nr:MAG: Myo-inositol 2-dehydrogenase [Ignavibacteriota bacterium]
MKTVKIGIVGLGWVSQVFHLPILKKLSDVEIVAICDIDKTKCQVVAEKFGIRKYYTNYIDMFEHEDINAVDICTPTDTHKAIILEATKRNLNIFVERPVARYHQEAVDIAEAVNEKKIKLMVGMNNRFRPDMMLLKSIIESNELGKIMYVKTGWIKKISTDKKWMIQIDKSGGGVFIDLGLAALDTLLWTVNFTEIKRVSAFTFYNTTKNVEDTCIAYFETKDNAVLTLETSWSFQTVTDQFYCDIYGTKGTAQINPLKIFKNYGTDVVNVFPTKLESPQNIAKKSYENELKHFIGSVRDLHPLISTIDEAIKRMKVVEAVYKSAKSKKEIVIK